MPKVNIFKQIVSLALLSSLVILFQNFSSLKSEETIEVKTFEQLIDINSLLSDETLRLRENIFVGDVIGVNGFQYLVLGENSQETGDECLDSCDLKTSGGLRLKVLRMSERRIFPGRDPVKVLNVRAFGDIGEVREKLNGDIFYPDASWAFERALRRGGRVFIPIGVYPVSEALVIRHRSQLYIEQNVSVGARIIHKVGTHDNLIRNANATASLKKFVDLVLEDTTVTGEAANIGKVFNIAGHRYKVVHPDSDYTNIMNAYGVKFIPALDKGIRVTGIGATDGTNFAATFKQNGKYNRIEKVFDPSKNRMVNSQRWKWGGFLFENVQDIRVSKVEIQDATKFGISCQSGCFDAVFNELRFNQPAERKVVGVDGSVSIVGIPNQDCINIRQMSRRIKVSNIYGTCGDDVVALSGLEQSWIPGEEISKKTTQINMHIPYHQLAEGEITLEDEEKYRKKGKLPTRARDIYDVEIKNIFADPIGSHHVVRLLGSHDVAVHKVVIKKINNNTTWKELEGNKWDSLAIDAAVLIGSSRYGRDKSKDPNLEENPGGQFDTDHMHNSDRFIHNVEISDVTTAAKSAVKFQWSASDVRMKNLVSNWKKTVKYKGEWHRATHGLNASLIRFEVEDELLYDRNLSREKPGNIKYPAPPEGMIQFSDIELDGGEMIHSGGAPNDAGVLKYGQAVYFDNGVEISNSHFNGVNIRFAQHAVIVGFEVLMNGVSFNNFTIGGLRQMAFRVKDRLEGAYARSWSASNFVVTNPNRLWSNHGNKGRFYSKNNDMKLLRGMPDVTHEKGAQIPLAVEGSQVRFSDRVTGFEEGLAVGQNGRWVAQ